MATTELPIKDDIHDAGRSRRSMFCSQATPQDMPEISKWRWTKDFGDATSPLRWPKGIRRRPCPLIARLHSAEIKAGTAIT